MREYLRDWRDEWIETNGETNGLEVVISDSSQDSLVSYVYEGSFRDIPAELFDKKVVQSGKILESSIQARIGAYSLKI